MVDATLISYLPMAVILINENLEVTGASRPAFAVFGMKLQDQTGQALTRALLEKTSLTPLLSAATLRLQKPGSNEKFHWVDDQRFYHVTVSALPSSDVSLYSVCFEDYTDHIAMERSNARARVYLESIMSSLHLGIVVTDRDLRITNMNRIQESFLRTCGSTVSLLQAIGMTLTELIPEETEIMDKIKQEVFQEGMVCAGIVERMPSDNGETVFSISFSPLRDENDKITGMLRVAEDITEKQRMEAELHQAELRASEIEGIKKVIVTLKHEINNALMTIMGNTELLRRSQKDLSDGQRGMLDAIMIKAEKMASVTRQLETMNQVRTVDYLNDGPKMIDTGSG